jgi:hypothetical protein
MNTSQNWIVVTESQYAWERDALEFVRHQFPTHEPYRAWSNFEFIPTASFNSLSSVPVLQGVVTSRSWLTSDTLRWSWDPTSSVSSGAGTFGGETEV